ncbi:MAG TPA: ABATE domain-containing protein [Acidimicrobiales bacterium]|nr:ABATE domain-containing protein [Acidimicrobiales bacterium]
MELLPGHVVRRDQPLAIELVSTRHVLDGQTVDALTTPAGLEAWLEVNAARLGGAAGRIDAAAALDRVRDLRDAVDRLLRAVADKGSPRSDDVEAVNAAARGAPSHRELRWSRGRAPQAVEVTPAGPADALLARLAADGAAVVAGERGEIGACGGPGCILLFVRTRPRQTWCSPTCGNRARVARHYRRTRDARS